MFKSRLQELCQKKQWIPPKYSSNQDGPSHCPRFKASVVVNGVSFDSRDFSNSSKEAQNEAAKVAYENFVFPVSSVSKSSVSNASAPSSQLGSSIASTELNNPPSSEGTPLQNNLDKLQDTPLPGNVSGGKDDKLHGQKLRISLSSGNVSGVEGDKCEDVLHVHKNQLQNYATRRGLVLPDYTHVRSGPPHAPLFKAVVAIDGQAFESPKMFRTLKEAEHSAAKVALSSLSNDVNREEDCSLYKSLLQELTLKEGFSAPVYDTTQRGAPHAPIFFSTVEVASGVFHGIEARTKKQAELYAAKVAYSSLKQGSSREVTDLKYSCSGEETLLQNNHDKLQNTPPSGNVLGVKADKLNQEMYQNTSASGNVSGIKDYKLKDALNVDKKAEHASAKVVLSSLSKDGNQEENCSVYKNLLQELTLKEGFSSPVYDTTPYGASHEPIFVSTVEIEGDVFRGTEARTKKQAEMNVAKVAYSSLKQRRSGRIRQEVPTIAVTTGSQQNLKHIDNLMSTLSIRSGEGKDGDQQANSSETTSKTVKAGAHSPPKASTKSSPSTDMIYARLRDPFPSVSSSRSSVPSSPEDAPSSPTTVLQRSSSLGQNLIRDLPIETSSSPTTVLQRSSSSGQNLIRDLPIETSSLLCNKVRIYPYKPNMKFPDDVTVMPISDDKWVAVSLDFPKFQGN